MPWQFFYLFLFFHVSLRHGLEELVTIPYINYQTIWKHKVSVYIHNSLTLSWRRPLSYRNQSIDLLRKSMGWFLDDKGLRLERVNCFWGNDEIITMMVYMNGNQMLRYQTTKVTKMIHTIMRLMCLTYKHVNGVL